MNDAHDSNETPVASETAAMASAVAEAVAKAPCPDSALLSYLKSFLAPPDRPDCLGRLDKYHVRALLGKGGMGMVLLAEDPDLGRPVAIKLMLPDAGERLHARQRFVREARSAAAVRHPRVVEIHHVGEWQGAPYLVMPYLTGQSLGRRLQHGPPPTLAEGVRLAREAAEGLAAAHAKGLIHRDIKPDNLFLDSTDDGTHVLVVDFGLARGDDSERLTVPGAVVGTPNYMAPEQASGSSVTARADLFSLGCVLYELLTGRKAFSGSNVISVLNALANHTPQPPCALAPTVPPALSDLTMRLLEKDPDRRPGSAVEVAAELRRFEGDGGASATTVTWMPKSPPVWRRWPNWLWPSAALVVVAGVAVIASVRRGDESDPSKGSTTSGVVNPLPAAGPLRVTAIEVSHFAKTADGDVPRGLLGKESFQPRLGDRVQVAAKLSKPAYAYVIAFRPDGGEELCFPGDDGAAPPLTDNPRYPITNELLAYGLREGTGLWAFAVVASERPLPAYRDWKSQRSDGALPWKSALKAPPGIIWWDNGQTHVAAYSATNMTNTLRGKDELLEGPAVTLKRLTDALRTAGKADTASAIGFAVTPRD